MKEITRIHIAKTAYDIEVAAKKQLEKYIHSVESYTQDADVLTDIEIRITELLAERGVQAGGVIASDDVVAIRAQLGEPYEFADEGGDIAVGSNTESSQRRLYRSPDDAILGGVLSGIAAYFKVNPLWTRLVFILLTFISFGFSLLLYVLFWIMTPLARTATEKLQLAGKEVTIESIREINASEEKAPQNRTAKVVQAIFSIGLGSVSALSALVTFGVSIWLVVAGLGANREFLDMTNGFMGLGDGNVWLVWLLFWITVTGMLLLTSLFALAAYAFFARKLTKKIVLSGVIIVVLGIAAAATVIGIGSTQSLRVANESRAMARESKTTLPKDFATVTEAKITIVQKVSPDAQNYFNSYPRVRYVVDEGPARYELKALPTAKVTAVQDGASAQLTLEIPASFRNSFVQPELVVYGPALQSLRTEAIDVSGEVAYEGAGQESLTVNGSEGVSANVYGAYDTVVAQGVGTINLGGAAVVALDVQSEAGLQVSAGTVRTLTVQQPDVCANESNFGTARVSVAGVTSGKMLYNGQELAAKTHTTGCASVVFEELDQFAQ